MYWTLELASYLSDAPWPATRDELIDYAIRTGAPLEVVENLQAIEEEEEELQMQPIGEEEESLQAHLEAKDNQDYPVKIGEYVTAGVEDFSRHHRRGDEPLIRHKGFVIFVKKASNDLELGDVVTVKVSSFNEGDSANAVFITRSENE